MKLPIATFLLAFATGAGAVTPAEIQAGFEAAARQASPGFGGFSAARGEQFFRSTHGGQWSCASCHGAMPVAEGRHARTGKPIGALAPSANPARFTDPARVDKWFRRNCNDVLARECTVLEKGDVMAFLLKTGR